MKKIILKIVLLTGIACSYLFIPAIQGILSYPISFFSMGRYVAKGLYEDATAVSTSSLVVKDYTLLDGRLYIFPLDEQIVLPVDMMVCEVGQDSLEFIALDERYTLSHYKTSNVYIYQYVHAQNKIGTTYDFYVIDGEEVALIAERLTIYYEKI